MWPLWSISIEDTGSNRISSTCIRSWFRQYPRRERRLHLQPVFQWVDKNQSPSVFDALISFADQYCVVFLIVGPMLDTAGGQGQISAVSVEYATAQFLEQAETRLRDLRAQEHFSCYLFKRSLIAVIERSFVHGRSHLLVCVRMMVEASLHLLMTGFSESLVDELSRIGR